LIDAVFNKRHVKIEAIPLFTWHFEHPVPLSIATLKNPLIRMTMGKVAILKKAADIGEPNLC